MKVSDYLAKPVRPEDLLDSIRKALAETEAAEPLQYPLDKPAHISAEPSPGSVGANPSHIITLTSAVTVNCTRRSITWSKNEISLTPIEARLLMHMFANHKQLIAHRDLVKAVYGYSLSSLEAAKILRTAISRLNKKLARVPGGRSWIENVRGAGYLLDVSPEKIVT